MTEFEQTQASILGTDIDSNPYLPETTLYSTNKGLKTVKKNVIGAINELLEVIGLMEENKKKILELLGGAVGEDVLNVVMEAQGNMLSVSGAAMAKTFSTITDVIESKEIAVGDTIRTLGYNEPFDGGAGFYFIRESNENRPWAIELRSGLYACLASLP